MVLVEETNAGDTSRPECPCDDQERGPLASMYRPLGGTVSEGDTRSPYGGGVALARSGTAGRLLPVDVTDTPVLSVEGPRSVPSRISMVLVDGTMAGDTPGRECPRENGYWRPRAGETRPAGVSVGGGDAGLPRTGETLSSPDVAGRSLPVVPAGGSSSVGAADPAGPDGPVVAGGPVDPCGTLSPLFPCLCCNVGMCGVPQMYLCNRFKCYISGDALHGSGSRINPIKCHRSCVIHYFPDPLARYQYISQQQ